MSNSIQNKYIQQTINWLESVVIGFNFCPFAKRELMRKSIHYFVAKSSKIEDCLLDLSKEMQRLKEHQEIETTLLIFPLMFDDFYDYLDMVDLGQALLEEQGYEGILQLATFHPDYCFATAPVHDPANYTNRSPYPMLHLIREASIERVLEHYQEPESIPERNMKVAREQGLENMQKILSKCYQLNE